MCACVLVFLAKLGRGEAMRLFCWLWRYTARCCAQLTVVVAVNERWSDEQGLGLLLRPRAGLEHFGSLVLFCRFYRGLGRC